MRRGNLLVQHEELRGERCGDHRWLLAFDLRDANRANEPVEVAVGNAELPRPADKTRAFGFRADQTDEIEHAALQAPAP